MRSGIVQVAPKTSTIDWTINGYEAFLDSEYQPFIESERFYPFNCGLAMRLVACKKHSDDENVIDFTLEIVDPTPKHLFWSLRAYCNGGVCCNSMSRKSFGK